jgi:hypothetical protein
MTFTLGYTTTPNTTAYTTSLNNQNQMAIVVTAPSSGAQITSISCYFGGYGRTITAAMCIWNTSGTLLTTSGYFTAPSNSFTPGGQGWQTQSIGPYNLTPGSSVYIGWWRAPSQNQVWSENSGGLVEWLSDNLSGSPGNMGANEAGSGVPGIYCTCNSTGGLPWWNGSAWQKSKVKSWNGSSWIWHPGYFWNGSFWQHNF